MADAVTGMLDPLAGFLQSWAGRPFVWGRSCCACYALAWAEARAARALEPAPVFPASARAHLATADRMEGRANGILAALGWRRAEITTMRRGDIALVASAPTPSLAIAVSATRVAGRSTAGVLIAPAAPLALWRFEG